jgi:hypothetical protein
MVNVAHDRHEAKKSIQSCLTFGLILTAVGIVIAASANPHTEVNSEFGNLDEKGSVAGYVVGLVGIGIGSTLVWIAAIAYAVSLGIRFGRRD